MPYIEYHHVDLSIPVNSSNLGMKNKNNEAMRGDARRCEANSFIRDVNNNNSKQAPSYWPQRNESFTFILCTESPPPRLTGLD